jgi:hypothetical protein
MRLAEETGNYTNMLAGKPDGSFESIRDDHVHIDLGGNMI